MHNINNAIYFIFFFNFIFLLILCKLFYARMSNMFNLLLKMAAAGIKFYWLFRNVRSSTPYFVSTMLWYLYTRSLTHAHYSGKHTL